jgi:hypothetical protein
MGIIPIPDHKLVIGKANEDGMGKEGVKGSNKPITDISRHFANNAPLWFYILAEAMQTFEDNNTSLHLGPVGGRIVGEVFVGLMYGDASSIFGHPTWSPYPEFLNSKEQFGIAELIAQGMLSEKG